MSACGQGDATMMDKDAIAEVYTAACEILKTEPDATKAVSALVRRVNTSKTLPAAAKFLLVKGALAVLMEFESLPSLCAEMRMHTLTGEDHA